MKKKLLLILFALIFAMSSICFVACTNTQSGTQTPVEESEYRKIYNAYVVCAESNGDTPLSYESWILTIKGKDGIDGKDGKDGKDGIDGKTPEFREFEGNLQWKYTDETEWKTIYELPKAEEENLQGLDFYPLPDGTYAVEAGKTKHLESIVIPASYKGKAVTSIGNHAFSRYSSLTSITIPDSVKSIGDNAFYDCSSLETVYYKGTAEDWKNVTIGSNNDDWLYTTRYYSETKPTVNPFKYWHFVESVPTVWPDNYIYFGTYPQTDVTSSMGGTLSGYVINKPTNGNNNGWTSYKYYISGSNSTDYMWYKDVSYTDGEKYRAVYFTSYRPYLIHGGSSTDNSCQDDNGYNTGNVYWFKFEPIKWRMLSESNGKALILSELIIDSQQFDYDGSYSNNYAKSTIRAWLNDTFFNTAFNELEKEVINKVTVDNSARSTNPDNNATKWNKGVNNHACNDTEDKVFLLSEQEVTNGDYGFNTNPESSDTARSKKNSDYAKCQGTYTYRGNGCWWLRSPLYSSDCYSCFVYLDGYSDYIGSFYVTGGGVVPALLITL